MGWTSTSDNRLEAFINVTVVGLKWHSGSQEGLISGFLYHASDGRRIWTNIKRPLLGGSRGLEESENISLVSVRQEMMEKLEKYANK
jgi:hypothetical protein